MSSNVSEYSKENEGGFNPFSFEDENYPSEYPPDSNLQRSFTDNWQVCSSESTCDGSETKQFTSNFQPSGPAIINVEIDDRDSENGIVRVEIDDRDSKYEIVSDVSDISADPNFQIRSDTNHFDSLDAAAEKVKNCAKEFQETVLEWSSTLLRLPYSLRVENLLND